MTSSHRRPTAAKGVWVAWTVVFVGGLLVLVATGLALTDPCTGVGRAAVRAACEPSQGATLAARLAIAGTSVAVVGGVGAAMVLVRRLPQRRRDASRAASPDDPRGV